MSQGVLWRDADLSSAADSLTRQQLQVCRVPFFFPLFLPFSSLFLHRHAIQALAACVVMLAAQFGVEALQRHHLKPVFEFRKRPMWEPKDWYYQPIPGDGWRQVNCPV